MANSLAQRRRALAAAVGCALLAVLIVGCHSGKVAAIHASMTVSSASELLDQPVMVSVSGLPKAAQVTVTASAADSHGTRWASSAQFTASTAGTVSLAQASHGGSYTGIFPMGLFELMAPPAGDTKDTEFVPPAIGFDVTLQAVVGGRTMANVATHRQAPAELGIVTRDLRVARDGLFGELYLPAKTPARHAAVLLFGGSEGGLSGVLNSKLLAAHGYPTLNLAYFKEPGLPRTLSNVPLEYFAKALTLLRAQPGVDPAHVLVDGGSRGGEAALILGAVYPNLVNGVIAQVPSSQVNPAYPGDGLAWTLHGAALPFDIIPVEKIKGPIFITCGGDDRIWDSCQYAAEINLDLTGSHFRYPVTSLNYTDAGHFGAQPQVYLSATQAWFDETGGSLIDDQKAKADGYPKLLAFLAKQ